MLPGAALTFNLLFSVPPAARPNDLIYSAVRVSGGTNVDSKRITDFRVSLASEDTQAGSLR